MPSVSANNGNVPQIEDHSCPSPAQLRTGKLGVLSSGGSVSLVTTNIVSQLTFGLNITLQSTGWPGLVSEPESG